MAITFVAAGTGAANVTGSCSASIPASIAANDLLLYVIASNNEGVTFSTPSGWTAVGSWSLTSTDVTLTIFSKTATGSESGSVAATVSGGSAANNAGQIVAYRPGTGNILVVTDTDGGADTSSGTSHSATGAGITCNAAGDYLVSCSGYNSNTAPSSRTLTVSGSPTVTLGGINGRASTGGSTGATVRMDVADKPVNSISGGGPSTVAPTYTCTTGDGTGSTAFLVLQEQAGAVDATPTPAAVAAVAAVPAPTVSITHTVAAALVAGVVAVAAPSLLTGATVTPAAVARSVVVSAPTLSAGSKATPSTVARSVVVPAPSVATEGNASPQPLVVAGVAAVPAPSVSAAAAPTPAAVAAVVAVPAPSAGAVSVGVVSVRVDVTLAGDQTYQPSTPTPLAVTAEASVGAPTLRAGVDKVPTPAAAVAAVATPTVATGRRIPGGPVAAQAVVPRPTVLTASGGSSVMQKLAGVHLLQQTSEALYTLANMRTAIQTVPSASVIGIRYLWNSACDANGDLVTTSGGLIPTFVSRLETIRAEQGRTDLYGSLRLLAGTNWPTALWNAIPSAGRFSGADPFTGHSGNAVHPAYNAAVTHTHDGLATHSHAVGDPNDVAIAQVKRHYQQVVDYLQAAGKLDLFPVIHGCYFGHQYSEYYAGQLTNPSTVNYEWVHHREGHKALATAISEVLVPLNVCTEYASTGQGPMVGDWTNGTAVGGNQFIEAMSDHLYDLYGPDGHDRLDLVYMNCNGWSDVQIMGGNDDEAAEWNKQYALRGRPTRHGDIFVGLQDILRSGSDNFDWNLAFQFAYDTTGSVPNDVLGPYVTNQNPTRRTLGKPSNYTVNRAVCAEVYWARTTGNASTYKAQLEPLAAAFRADVLARM